MATKYNRMFTSIIIEAITFLSIGMLFAGKFIFDVHSSTFTYVIFGIASILLINILEYISFRNFVFAAIVFAIIFMIAYYNNYMPLYSVRNLLWFLFIGFSIYYSSKFLTQEKYKTRKFLGIAVWMINFAVVYLIMTLINTYAFKFYDSAMIKQFLIIAFNMGTSMGLGIGIGYEVSRRYLREANTKKVVE